MRVFTFRLYFGGPSVRTCARVALARSFHAHLAWAFCFSFRYVACAPVWIFWLRCFRGHPVDSVSCCLSNIKQVALYAHYDVWCYVLCSTIATRTVDWLHNVISFLDNRVRLATSRSIFSTNKPVARVTNSIFSTNKPVVRVGLQGKGCLGCLVVRSTLSQWPG